MTTTIIPTKTVAALLRKELRAAFPGVKFSVRCSTGTASAWIDVSHVDGPTIAQVDAIASRFEGRSFNGQTDSYDDNGTTLVAGDGDELPTEVRYSCDGILTTRAYSPAGHLAAQRIVQERSNMPHLVLCDDDGDLTADRDLTGGHGEDFNDGDRAWQYPTLSAWEAVRFLLQHVDLTPTPAHQ
ncbi:LPD29 domain-containing protein [Curtobacterium sp. L1-20]|uniref:LPD29 domain-containing protein n=1 Tax=Curtobacterium sp. L1-20 TaxID=3138181 RepID=UPI003B51718E